LYFEYIRERLGKESTVVPDKGFAIYFDTPHGLYVEEIYVKPECRREGVAEALMVRLQHIAKERNFKYLIGSVEINSTNPEPSLIGMLKNGFKLHENSGSMIYLKKEI